MGTSTVFLYDARKKNNIENLLGGRNSNIPIVYLSKGQASAVNDILFGDIPIGSPLSYQVRDYHSSNTELSTYLPTTVDMVLEDFFLEIPIPQPNLNNM
jgi:hypothetical protein